MYVLTFVTPKPQKDFDLWIKKAYPDIHIESREILDDRAIRWHINTPLKNEGINKIRREFHIDVFQTDNMSVQLFMADMDSTIVKGETLDDMADMVGLGQEISNITARAMAGELDFISAITERVSMLRNFPANIIDKAIDNLEYNEGARELLTHLQSKNIQCVLISGGFTQFTSYVANDLGFNDHFGNELIIAQPHSDLVITGEVKHPILDKNFKQSKLLEIQQKNNLKSSEIMAIGDGANDIPMLQSAGIGIAYHGKPLLREAVTNQINYTDLKSVMYIV